MPRQPKTRRLTDVLFQDRLIKKSPILKRLISHSQSADQIEKWLDECLPDPLKGQLQIASFKNTILKLVCSSAAIATRFRFEQDRVLTALQMRTGLRNLSTIEIMIRPKTNYLSPNKTKKTDNAATKETRKKKPLEERLDEMIDRIDKRST